MGKSVFKILTIVALVVGTVALIATGVGAVIGAAAVTSFLGVSASTLMLISGAISIGASLLAPHPKAPGVSQETLGRLNVTLDPRAPRKAVFGQTALATDMIDQEVNKQSDKLILVDRFVCVAAHKVTSIDEIWFDEKKVWANGTVFAVGSDNFPQYLSVSVITEGSAANAINISGRMGSSRRMTGCAYVRFRFRVEEKSPFQSSIPTRVTIKGKGMPIYDPRLDSTQPGGSGAQRASDQTTWTFGASSGRNPALQMLTWLIGWRINTKLSVGKGMPIDRIDVPSFMAAANICDETVTRADLTTEPRYQTDGIISEGDDVLAAVDRWKTSMNATLDDVDGQIRVQVLTNDLATYSVTLTDDDIIEGDFNWKPFEGLTGSYNIIRGSFVDPSDTALFQLVEYPETKITSLDGIDRWETVDYGMVQSRSQAARLSKSRLQRSQYPGTFQATFQVTAWKAQKGDIVRLNFDRLGFVNKLFRVASLEHRPDGRVPMLLREENAATYAWDKEEGPAPVYPVVSGFDSTVSPWYMIASGQWGIGTADANLYTDDVFGGAWTETAPAFQSFVNLEVASTPWPNKAARPYLLEVPYNAPAAGPVNLAAHKSILNPVPGKTYFIGARVAKAVGSTGTAIKVRQYLRAFDINNVQIDELANEWLLSELVAGTYLDKITSRPASALAARLESGFELLGGAGVGTLRIDAPTLLDKEPGADVSAIVGYGPTEFTVKYQADGVTLEAGELPRDYTWKLQTPTGTVTGGVTWTYRVISGKLNNKMASDGPQAMTLNGGAGVLSLTGLQSDTRIEVIATYGGRARSAFANGTRDVAAAAPPPAGGGAGGVAATLATKTSAFTSHSATSYTEIGQVTGTIPSGHTSFTANFATTHTPSGNVVGDWTVSAKMQKESPYNSNTWVDIGAVSSGASSVYTYTDTAAAPSGRMALPVGGTVITERTPADLAASIQVAAVAGDNIRVRVVALVNLTRLHDVSGQITLKVP